MERVNRGLFCLLTASLQGSSAASVLLRAPAREFRSAAGAVHQSLAPDRQEMWQAEISPMLTSLLNQLEPVAAHQKTAQATAENEDATKKADKAQPLAIQVPEKELKSFMAELSKQCREQFSAIIHDQGPPIHTYGAAGSNKSAAACTSLHGVLCATQAYVTERSDTHGRTLHSVTTAEGNGCLPRDCLAQRDLETLATFMQAKAKEAILGGNTEVTLRVDCRRGGGSMTEVGNATGGAGSTSSSSPHESREQSGHEVGNSSQEQDHGKSAASPLTPSAVTASTFLSLMLLSSMH